MQDKANARILSADDTLVIGEHFGLTGAKGIVRRQRTFEIKNLSNYLVIVDEVENASKGDKIDWYFQLAPGLTARVEDELVVIEKKGERICSLKASDLSLKFSLEEVEHSPSYGVVIPAKRIHLSGLVADPASCRFVFTVSWVKKDP